MFQTCFEAVKKDPLKTMKALGKFFGVERTNEFYEEVVEKTSFDYVKAARDAQSKSVSILYSAVDFLEWCSCI